MTARRICVLAGVLTAAVLGCERHNAPSAGSSSAPPSTAVTPGGALTATTHAWDVKTLGPALIVPADAAEEALALYPDSASATSALAMAHSSGVTLFSRTGSMVSVSLIPPLDTATCSTWRIASGPLANAWTVGFFSRDVRPVTLDSLGGKPAADSERVIVNLRRLASALPNDSAGRFVGLPFTVRNAWRAQLPSGEVVVATLMRQVNQEATPLQERTLMILERFRDSSQSTWTAAYHEQSRGAEETIETFDAAAIVLVGPSAIPTVVIGRDYGNANAYSLIQRQPSGSWQVLWTSRPYHC